MDDHTIQIVGRGRLKGMVEQIGGCILNFRVNYDRETHLYSLVYEGALRFFPSIFPRQLDHAQRMKSKIIMTQDTPDQEKFEAFAVDLKAKRSDGNN